MKRTRRGGKIKMPTCWFCKIIMNSQKGYLLFKEMVLLDISVDLNAEKIIKWVEKIKKLVGLERA